MEWTIAITPFSFPYFMVWTKNANGKSKTRMIINIRALNKITMLDVYPILFQTDIMVIIKKFNYISVVNTAKFFYQWWVNKIDRHRLTVVSHRGQKIFRIPIMRYRNSPIYVQQMIDQIFRPHRKFSKIYIDDIVIFCFFGRTHQTPEWCDFFCQKKFHLTGYKSFFGYPSIQFFGQKIRKINSALFFCLFRKDWRNSKIISDW